MFSKTQPRPSRCPRCKRCRQKKIKCDYASPRCGHCAKAKVTCEPYKHQYLFIHADGTHLEDTSAPPVKEVGSSGAQLQQQPWRVATSTQYSSLEKQQQQQKQPTQLPLQWPDESGGHGDDGPWEWHVVTAAPRFVAPLPTAQDLRGSPMLMTGSLARAVVFDQFLRYYLPDGPRLYAHQSSRSWLSTARNNRQSFPPLEAAACALGVLTLGRGTKDTAMQRRGFSLYGDALGFVGRLIAQTQLDDRNWLRVLETVNLLSLFEALAPHSKQKTLSHVAGLCALLKVRSPTAFQEREAHNIFLHARSAIIYTAILEEKATFLEEYKWIEEPWVYMEKAHISLSLDIVVHVPRLLELANQIDAAVAMGMDYTLLLEQFDAQSALIQNLRDDTAALFIRTPPEESNGNVHEFAAAQLHLSCELFRHEALRRVACHASHDVLFFGRYVEEVERALPDMEMSARTIIADINDFNTDDCGFLTANMLFLPTLAANQFLKRNNSHDEEVMASCRMTADTFIDRGFHFFSSYA